MMYKFGREADGMSGRADGPQFSLGGDTWVLGCAIPPTALFPELSKLNPDVTDPVYGTELGCYKEGQGIMNLRFVIGHDEYMYRWLLFNKVRTATSSSSVKGLSRRRGLAMLAHDYTI